MSGYVYLICDPETELYKIGVTRGSIEKRLRKLQTGNGTALHVAAYHPTEYPYRVEKMLHNRYAGRRAMNEWFDLEDEEVFSFLDACKEIEGIISALSDNPFFTKKLS